MREMKDSGFEYIGEIPIEWQIVPTKNIFKILSGSTPKSNCNEYFDGDVPWITPADYDTKDKYIYHGKRFITKKGFDSCSASMIPSNSIIFSKRAPIGLVAINKNKLCTNQGCLSCIQKKKIDVEYYYYLMSVITEHYEMLGDGTTFKEISLSKFSDVRLVYPDLNMQENIARFLNDKCCKIDALTLDIEKQIQLLEDYKKSVITEAVTKGINPDVEMKDSGIEWIGEIPKNWKIGKVKYAYDIVLGKMIQQAQKNNYESYENYICAANIKWNGINTEINKKMWFSLNEKKQYILNEGDILIMEGGLAGTACVYKGEFAPCYIQNSVNRARAKKNFNNKFLYYWLYKVFYSKYIDSICNKATIQHFTKEKLSETPLVIIPSDIQEKIVDFLDEKCSDIDNIINKKQNQIDKLNEYKKSLIYEYVTGKKEIKLSRGI